MRGFERASDEELARRNSIADRVIAALAQAGLAGSQSLSAGGSGSPQPGALVTVHPHRDVAGSSVQVDWMPSHDLVDSANAALEAGDLTAEVIVLSGSVSEAMQPAIAAILRLSGFQVSPSDDDMTPFAVDVLDADDGGRPDLGQ